MTPKEHVILLHGLAENPIYMLPLQLGLSAAGYQVSNIGYPSTKFSNEELVDRIVRPVIERYADVPKLHLVGHSMGCILIRAALEAYRPPNLGRVVMHAPGNRGSEMLEIQKHLPVMQWLLGPSLDQSGTDEDCYALTLDEAVDYEVGILAGTVALDPLAVVLPWPNDGKISLQRARMSGARDFLTLPAPHDLIQAHPWAVFQTLHFLREGQFLKAWTLYDAA